MYRQSRRHRNDAEKTISCNQCGSSSSKTIGRGTDREYFTADDEYTIVQCTNCGLTYLNPRPVTAELPRIYPPNYHSYILDQAHGSKGSFITAMRQKAGANRFGRALSHLAGYQKIDLLDVGCRNGWMMEVYKSLSPDRIRTYGVEISEDVCAAARSLGHTVYCGRFEDVDLDRTFDLVNLTHVIEHVSDPRLVVRKAFGALEPGGLLVMETPNIGSFEWPLFQRGTWGAYHIPRHWYFYNKDTIRTLGESEGFELIDWYCHPSPTHWVWTMHNISCGKNGVMARLGRKVFDPIKVFRRGLVSTGIMGTFFVLDSVMLALRYKTSVMTGVFRKPA